MRKPIAAARIGSGGVMIFLGAVGLALGVLLSAAGSSAMDPGLSGFGFGLALLGGALLSIGFWVRLFGRIEARLIDIQRDLRGEEPTAEAVKPAGDKVIETY